MNNTKIFVRHARGICNRM